MLLLLPLSLGLDALFGGLGQQIDALEVRAPPDVLLPHRLLAPNLGLLAGLLARVMRLAVVAGTSGQVQGAEEVPQVIGTA